MFYQLRSVPLRTNIYTHYIRTLINPTMRDPENCECPVIRKPTEHVKEEPEVIDVYYETCRKENGNTMIVDVDKNKKLEYEKSKTNDDSVARDQ